MAERSSEKYSEENIREMHESFCTYNTVDYSIGEYCLDLFEVLFKVNAKFKQFFNKNTKNLPVNFF